MTMQAPDINKNIVHLMLVPLWNFRCFTSAHAFQSSLL